MSVIEAWARLATAHLDGAVRRDEPLARHTTFGIGGPAALYVECDSLHDVATTFEILAECEVEWTVLGKGSNMLVSDVGYPGAIVVLGRDFKRHGIDGSHLRSGAGVILAALVQDAFSTGMTGLEFAVGIPGTLGGALAMNAGSRSEWIGEVVESVTIFVPGEGMRRLRGSEISWGYRRTDLAARGIALEASLRLEPGDVVDIRRRMESGLRRRKVSQPIGTRNAGSVFVNPDGDSAGRLIESLGLKGVGHGGAQVSEVHANFIVNTGGATAADVVALITRIHDAVRDEYGIELRPEVRFLGPFDSA